MITLAEKLITSSGNSALKAADPSTYVEFVSSTPMKIRAYAANSGVTLQYSLDAKKWTTIKSGVLTPSANIIYFRGQATGTKRLNPPVYEGTWYFTDSTNLECNGKLDRLIQDTLGGDKDILTIDSHCFNKMFSGATTLIKAPELPATTLAEACYQNMFYDCTSLTTAPKLPATTLANSCYSSMFTNCTSLRAAPKLPATTLANSCYYRMFQKCSSLTTLPNLPATTLVENCYTIMFSFCPSLKLSTTKTGVYDTAYRIPTTGTGTAATETALRDTLKNMFSDTGGTFTGTPTINTTYYTENTPV